VGIQSIINCHNGRYTVREALQRFTLTRVLPSLSYSTSLKVWKGSSPFFSNRTVARKKSKEKMHVH
jgi:hypothetical protein